MDDGAIREDLRRRIDASPFHAGFGITVEGARSGEVRLGWEARGEHRNLQGLVHGGVLATLVDIAMGLGGGDRVGGGGRRRTCRSS
jgi:acyl-coenzyme A thioesterase PaaI-like protein